MMLARRLLFLVLTSLLGQVSAATVAISPVVLEINAQQQLMSLTTVSNRGNTPVSFTASLLRWTQKDGQDVLEPTREAVVNPPRFTIAPGRSQVVRIGLRTRPSAPQVTYRPLLRQEPEPAAPVVVAPTTDSASTPAAPQVQAAISPTYVFSLPLFVSQPSAQANVKASLERGADSLNLVLSNSGNAFAVYRNLSTTANNEAVNLGSVYVLAGSTMRVGLPPALSAAKTVTVRFTDSAQQDRSETLDVPAP